MRFLKGFIGLLLLPACVGVSRTIHGLLLQLSGGTWSGWSPDVWALLGGFSLWIFIYFVMPRPMRTYVLAHELTHALWAWLMGVSVLGMKVSKRGGHVLLTKSNFLITLAPYFFPFYTLCVILIHAVLSLFFDTSPYDAIWLGWIGLTWGFHLTFTLSMIKVGQSDIREHGALFSYAIIYSFNLLGIGIWLVAVSDLTWTEWTHALGRDVSQVYLWLGAWIMHVVHWLAEA